jgi:ArsR family transcriptional regulator, arsenate/arsenite/antimonite-responsive transcriptional repressor
VFMCGYLAPATTIVNQLFEYTNCNGGAVLTCDVMVSKPMSPEERARVFKALADPRRVEIVELLAKGAQCGTIIAESLGISVALLCHHWEVLVDAGLLKKERQGQLRVCSLDAGRLREALSMGAASVEPQAPAHAKAKRAKNVRVKRAPKSLAGTPAPRPPAKKSKPPKQPRSLTSE